LIVILEIHLKKNLKKVVGGKLKLMFMKIFFGLITMIVGIFLIGYGLEIEKGLAYSAVGLILGFTGFKVMKS
jgi:hypothetical protein